jgi:hypothetical protein
MKTKYDQDDFAVYKGITFYTYYTCSGYIGLLTEDEKLAKKFNFLMHDDVYYKEVSPYEVTEYYEQRFEVKSIIVDKKGIQEIKKYKFYK